MKRSRDIEVSRLTAELNSTQFKLAFYMEKAENSVSREDYAAVMAERDAAISQTETIVKLHAEEKAALQAKHAAELAGVQDSLKEYQEAQALLQTENVDLKPLIEFWRSHQVQQRIYANSGIMAFLADRCPLYGTLVSALGSAPPVRGACWIHFRRYLLHAYLQDNRLEPMVQLLARLFQAEKIISGIKELTDTRRVRERGLMCRPLVDAMFTFMEKVKESGSDYGVLARRAASYLLDDREGFSSFLSCGLLEIGNNAVERCFRSIAKGRENWLQCGSHDAARHTAFMYSLIESCRMNDLDFGRYIETVLIRLQDGDTDFHGMLPNVIVLPETTGNASVA